MRLRDVPDDEVRATPGLGDAEASVPEERTVEVPPAVGPGVRALTKEGEVELCGSAAASA